MADTYTTTSHKSYFGRLGGALKGVLGGLVLFILSFLLLFWNEGRAVKRSRALAEGEKSVVAIDAGSVDPANEGKLVHFSGRTVCHGVLSDPAFAVSVTNDLRLVRTVEMYQWTESSRTETKKNVGGSEDTVTTYAYEREWRDSPVDSSGFARRDGHENPGEFAFPGKSFLADDVTVGAFAIPRELVSGVGGAVPLDIPGTNSPAGMSRISHGFYLPAAPGAPAGAPRVGDLRVTFGRVPSCDASFVARQTGGTIAPYATGSGTLFLVRDGLLDASAMFQAARHANATTTWFLRLAGFVVMLVGLNMVLRPLSVLASVLPFLGLVVGAGAGLVSFLVAEVCSLATIALAWLAYRPLVGAPLLVAAIALAVFGGRKLKCAKEPPDDSK